MIYLCAFEVYWEKEKAKRGLYPYRARKARDRRWAGPAARPRAGCRRRRRILMNTPSSGEGGSWRSPSPLKQCGALPSVAQPRWLADRWGPLAGSSSTSRAGATGDRGGARHRSPALQGVSGDVLPTGVLRRPGRVQPWVARSPRGTGWSRVLAAADGTGGEIWAR